MASPFPIPRTASASYAPPVGALRLRRLIAVAGIVALGLCLYQGYMKEKSRNH